MAVCTAPKGIQLQLRSPTGEVLAYLSDNEKIVNHINIKARVDTFGLDEMLINIPRDIDLPITRNSEIMLYVDSEQKLLGIVQENPTLDQSKTIIEVMTKGLIHELKRKIINVTYTSQTLDAIIKALGSTFLGADVNVFYDVAKITTPVITGITLDFTDCSLYDAFLICMQIANYSTTYYRFLVDLEKEFFFGPYSSTLQDHLFEGYHFQNPEVTIETSKMVNRILAYRSTLADPGVTEYVAAYDSTASQSKYGLFSKKLVFPNYIDSTTIQKIATWILNKRSNPLEKVTIDKVTPFKPRGKYRVSTKPNKYWKLITDCNLLSEWDLTHITDTVVTLSTVHVLTGRQSLKAVTTIGSENEYIELTLLKEIAFPEFIRAFIYFETAVDLIRLTYYDVNGNSESMDFGKMVQDLITSDGLLEVNGEQLIVDFIIDAATSTWMRLVKSTILKNIKKIRVTFLTNDALSIYFDRFDLFGNFYTTYELWLEDVEYEFSSKSKKMKMYFGDPAESFANEIEEKLEEGDVAFSIFGKP